MKTHDALLPVAILTMLLAGCASTQKFVEIADAAALRVLEEANADPDLADDGPFVLDDYDKTVREDEDSSGAEIVWVSYLIKRPTGILGHPTHFSIGVVKTTKKVQVIKGR